MKTFTRIAIVAVALALLVAAADARILNHENRLHFSRSVALPGGVVLQAGTYSFDVASPTALDVVVVRSPEKGTIFYTGFTRTVSRPRKMMSGPAIVFGEARANEPPPISTWYEIGNTTGHEFIY